MLLPCVRIDEEIIGSLFFWEIKTYLWRNCVLRNKNLPFEKYTTYLLRNNFLRNKYVQPPCEKYSLRNYFLRNKNLPQGLLCRRTNFYPCFDCRSLGLYCSLELIQSMNECEYVNSALNVRDDRGRDYNMLCRYMIGRAAHSSQDNVDRATLSAAFRSLYYVWLSCRPKPVRVGPSVRVLPRGADGGSGLPRDAQRGLRHPAGLARYVLDGRYFSLK